MYTGLCWGNWRDWREGVTMLSGRVEVYVCVGGWGGGKGESGGEKGRDREREQDVGGQQSTAVHSPAWGVSRGVRAAAHTCAEGALGVTQGGRQGSG